MASNSRPGGSECRWPISSSTARTAATPLRRRASGDSSRSPATKDRVDATVAGAPTSSMEPPVDAMVVVTVAATGSRFETDLVRAAAIGAGKEDSSRASARPSAASSPGLGATPIMCRWAERAASWVGPQEAAADVAGRSAAAADVATPWLSASTTRTADDSIDRRSRICPGLGKVVPSSEASAGEADASRRTAVRA